MDFAKSIRLFSLLGQRGTFGTVLKEFASADERIVAISADLTRTSGLEQFSKDYPKRFYNVGIAEENAIGMAAGLADNGLVPFVSTFANFAALRANEFVRHFMSYMRCNVKLVGLGSGFAMELFGNTHYGLEDIAVLRSMPNIIILSPADGLEVAKCVEYAVQVDDPCYIRLSGKMNNPIVHREDFCYVPNKAIELTAGSDLAIMATGSMVHVAMCVERSLSEKGIKASVLDYHTIKPFDVESVLCNKDKQLIVTIEEHCRIGGLGSAVAEVLATQTRHGKLISFGTGPEYLPAGSYDYMLKQNGLTFESITNTIIKSIEGDKND